MRALPRNSTDQGFSEPPPIFPCRPCLTVKNRSQNPQRKAPSAVAALVGDGQGEHAAVDGRPAFPRREAPLFAERAGATRRTVGLHSKGCNTITTLRPTGLLPKDRCSRGKTLLRNTI